MKKLTAAQTTAMEAIKADAAKAEFRGGLLTLTLPKTEEVKPTHVKIQVS